MRVFYLKNDNTYFYEDLGKIVGEVLKYPKSVWYYGIYLFMLNNCFLCAWMCSWY